MTEQSNSCTFCKVQQKTTVTNVRYEDDELIVIDDIDPASVFHFLVIPKEHIGSLSDLRKLHVTLVTKMKNVGLQVLTTNNGNTNDVLLGFHYPPSIFHLHLHVVSPKSIVENAKFEPSWIFYDVDDVIKKLQENDSYFDTSGNNPKFSSLVKELFQKFAKR